MAKVHTRPPNDDPSIRMGGDLHVNERSQSTPQLTVILLSVGFTLFYYMYGARSFGRLEHATHYACTLCSAIFRAHRATVEMCVCYVLGRLQGLRHSPPVVVVPSPSNIKEFEYTSQRTLLASHVVLSTTMKYSTITYGLNLTHASLKPDAPAGKRVS